MRTRHLLLLPCALALTALVGCGDKDDDDEEDDTANETETDADGDGYSADDDCDDDDAAVNPGADEICDGVDNDCDDLIDDADDNVDTTGAATFYADADADGFGDDAAAAPACAQPSGTVEVGGDCDDANPDAHPDATEVCDDADVDEDCSGDADDADSGVDTGTYTTWYSDGDDDGYGDLDDPGTLACDAPAEHVADNTDCEDGDGAVHPGAAEICNGVDDDCDAGTSEAGRVSFEDRAGTLSDVTADFSGGTSAAPAAYTVSTEGTLTFCDDRFYTHILVETDVQIAGMSGDEVLDGGGAGSVVDIQTDALSVSVVDIGIQNGEANNTWEGFTAGGGIHCAAATDLSLVNATLDGNSAELGGGLFSDGCAVDINDSALDNNLADAGGGLFATNGVVELVDSTLSGNLASAGGGLYAYDGAELDLLDTVVEANEAEWGAGLYQQGGAVSCTGSPTTAGGFISNVATEYGSAVVLRSEPATSTFDAVSCDLGEPGTSDDNTSPEIVAEIDSISYLAGDDATFSCTHDRCGTPTTTTMGSTDRASTSSGSLKGNVVLADTDLTLEAFRPHIGGGASCLVDYYVLTNTTTTDTGWTVAWSSLGNALSSTADFQDAATAGLLVEAGTYYALAFGFECTTSGEVVDYAFSLDGTTDDAGFGARTNNISEFYFPGTLSGTVEVDVQVTATATYYMEVDVVEL
jgi:hypothetical protein